MILMLNVLKISGKDPLPQASSLNQEQVRLNTEVFNRHTTALYRIRTHGICGIGPFYYNKYFVILPDEPLGTGPVV